MFHSRSHSSPVCDVCSVVNEGCFKYESGNTGKVSQCHIFQGANLLNLRCASDQVSQL